LGARLDADAEPMSYHETGAMWTARLRCSPTPSGILKFSPNGKSLKFVDMISHFLMYSESGHK
jgi:hypothetical protein